MQLKYQLKRLYNKKRIRKKLEEILVQAELLEKELRVPFRQWVKKEKNWSFAEKISKTMVEAGLDTNRYILSVLKQKKTSDKEAFLILVQLGILPPRFTEKILIAVDIRDILNHKTQTLSCYAFYIRMKPAPELYKKYVQYLEKALL